MRSDEIFHFYLGDAVEMLQLDAQGAGRIVRLGTDLASGERPQVIVPRGIWQGATLAAGGRFALLGTTVAPGFEYEDYEMPDAERLRAAYPAWEEWITRLAADGA